MSPQSQHPLQIASKLPMRQRIAALSEAIWVVPEGDRDEIAMMLIELASFHSSQQSGQDHVGSAAGPIELFTKLPLRWRERHADEAMLAIARSWGLLSSSMKELAVGLGRDRWLGVARKLAQDTDPRSRAAAALIAHDTADPGFGKIVGSLLADEHQSVRKAADKSMMRMTMVMLDHLPVSLLGKELAEIAAKPQIPLPADPTVLGLERCILLSAVADAAWSFAAHRCRSPLLSALLLMDRAIATPMEREISARMRRLLSERNHPSHSPMRTVLRRTPSPILRERALRWLPIAPISVAAIDRLNVAESLEEHEVVLRKAYLGLRPKRGARLGSLRQGTQQRDGRIELGSAGPMPGRNLYHQLSEDARRGMIAFSSLVSIDAQAKRDLFEPTLADPSPRIRLVACDAGSPIDLPDFMYDVDPSIARHAALKWSSVGNHPPKPSSPSGGYRKQVAGVNARSPHQWVRRVAQEESDRLTLVRPDCPASRSQARRMYKNDPAGFVRTIRDHLSDQSTRCDALMLIRLMNIEHRFELDLIAIVQHETRDQKANENNARSRASAVRALGCVDSKSARYMLSEALTDSDDRVRSNAAESVALIDAPFAQRIFELKADPSHRVRASVIRRMIRETGSESGFGSGSGSGSIGETRPVLQVRAGAQALLEMLHDDRPMHRLAATWVAQRTMIGKSREAMGATWRPLVSEIESLASTRQDPRIQSRAQSCIDRMASDLHFHQQTQIQAMNDSLDYGAEHI